MSPKPKRADPFQKNFHFSLIEAPRERIWPQVVVWGECAWWPPPSLMKFTRITSGDIHRGTRYLQKVRLPLGPAWQAEVTQLIPGRLIERTFLGGLFQGRETVTLEKRSHGTRVEYTMEYRIPHPINGLVWKLWFSKLHDQNIKLILSALKTYCESNKDKKEP